MRYPNNRKIQMKIKQIHIADYKVFKDFTISFCGKDQKILDIVVLAGINGSGKSTLLDFVCQSNFPKEEPSGHVCISDSDSDSIIFSFPGNMIESTYRPVLDSIIRPEIKTGSGNSDELTRQILKYVDKIVYVDGKTSYEAYGNIQAMLDDIFNEFSLAVRFKGIDADKNLVFQDIKGNTFGIDALSDGERQLLSKIFPLFFNDIEGKVIILDEPEESLHPSWQAVLLPLLRKCSERKGCQIILATHSPQIISSAHSDELRIMTKDENGHIKAETCGEGPYGWTIEKILLEVQGVRFNRDPEIENRLEVLRDKLDRGEFRTEEFENELASLETILGYSDKDLILIRMERLRKIKSENETDKQR